MTSFDIILVIVVVVAVVIGFRRGIITQIAAIGGLVAGIVLCRLFGDQASMFVAGLHLKPDEGGELIPSYFDKAVGNIALFAAGNIGLRIVARFFRRVTHAMSLGLLDRLAGGAFALFEWLLVLSLCLNLYYVINPDTKCNELSSFDEGKVVEAVGQLAPTVLGWATDAMERQNLKCGEIVDNN